ncbi:MAG: CDP-diacylglycerol--glycerol-3-phosphate 3-phosphatidyltransferase [bacterium]
MSALRDREPAAAGAGEPRASRVATAAATAPLATSAGASPSACSSPLAFLLSLNLPNRLTLARLVLAPVFGVLLLSRSTDAHVAAVALYLLLALTDLFDGWLARRTGIETAFGKFMDPLADKVLVAIALIGFVVMGLPFVPLALVVLIIGREFVVTALRSATGRRGAVLVSTLLAKAKTFVQNSFVVLALFAVVARERAGAPAAEGASNPYLLALLWIVTVLTLVSGALYFLPVRESARRVTR